MSNIFDKTSLPARDQVEDWANIKTNIGDSVSGQMIGWWTTPAKDGFKAQIGIAIKKEDDGKVVGVNVSDTQYMRDNVTCSQIGDRIGLRYEGDKDTGKPQPAKIIKFYNPDRAEREKNGIISQGSQPQSSPAITPPADTEEEDF